MGTATRSLANGIARVPRSEIVGFQETAHSSWAGSWLETRLAVATTRGPRLLAAPATSWTSPLRAQPDFHQIWSWLTDELAAPPVAAGPPTIDRRRA